MYLEEILIISEVATHLPTYSLIPPLIYRITFLVKLHYNKITNPPNQI